MPRLLVALSACLLFVLTTAYGQAPTWQEVVAGAIGSTDSDQCAIGKIVADSSGNVYVAGIFRGTITLDSIKLTTITSALLSKDDLFAFVAKWNRTSRRFAWARQIGNGSVYTTVTGLAVNERSVYVTGSFSGSTLVLDDLTLRTQPNGGDGYITKLTDAGSSARFTWARAMGGPLEDRLDAIVLRGNNIFVCGTFNGPRTTIGDTTLINKNPDPSVSRPRNDAFVVKLTDAGATSQINWAQLVGGPEEQVARGLAVQGTSVYLAGNFDSAMPDFAGGTMSAAGGLDLFVVKLRDAGRYSEPVWAQRAGGVKDEMVEALVARGANLYVAGNFASPTVTFGSTVLTNTGITDAFITKLSDAGASSSFTWVYQYGTPDYDGIYTLALQGNTLYARGSIPGSTRETLGKSAISKLTDTGQSARLEWTELANGQIPTVFALEVSNVGLYVAGRATTPLAFGGLSLAAPANRSVGFLALLTEPRTLTAVNGSSVLSGLACYPNPASTKVTVSLPAVVGEALATLSILDVLGRVQRVQQVRVGAMRTTSEMSLLNLMPGLYYVRMQVGNEYSTRPLVVK